MEIYWGEACQIYVTPVGAREVCRENAAIDPFPMENILRPAILGPRQNSEHGPHTQRPSGQTVRLHFGR